MKRNPTLSFVLTAICVGVAGLSCTAIQAQNTGRQPQQQKIAELYVPTGHTSTVASAAFSPDGKTLASGSADKTVKLWDVETGREIRTLAGHTSLVNSIAFSPDGKTLTSGSADETIKLWDIETGRETRTLTGHIHGVLSVAFSPDGKTLASGSYEDTIRLWDLQTGRELRKLAGHSSTVNSVAFSPDGRHLASSSDDETIKLWSVETGQELKTLAARAKGIAFSPDGKTLASGSDKAAIKLWDVETGRALRTLSGHSHSPNSIEFSPDGKLIASASADNTIRLWSVGAGKEIRTLSGDTKFVRLVAFSPDGKLIASASENTIKLRSVETGQTIRTLSENSSNVSAVAFSPDGKLLAEASWDKTIKVWSVETGRGIKTLAGHSNSVSSIAFSPDGKTLASAGAIKDGTIKLWNTETGQLTRTLSGHNGSVNSVVFSPDGKTLASAGGALDNKIKLWNAESGQEQKTLAGHSGDVRSVAFSPDGKTLASGSRDNTIKLWSVEAGQEIKTLKGHKGWVWSVAFSLDGKIVVSGSYDKTIRMWDAASGQLIKSLDRDDPNTMREVFQVVPDFTFQKEKEAITADGRFQIKSGANGQLDLYQLKTGKQLASLMTFGRTDWIVVTPEGLFDGSPAAWQQLYWRLNGNTFENAPVEAFFNEFYRPALLPDIFAGRNIEQPTRDISTIDIRQPAVKILAPDINLSAGSATRKLDVRIEVSDAATDARRTTSGAKDVRLFRNGSLIKLWRGDVLGGKSSTTLTATVPLVAGDNNFTAYAFNRENVKSRDSVLTVKGADALKRKGTAHILSIGVNEYANPQYNLRYAVADAQSFGVELKRRQETLGYYERVETTLLINENATKEKIITALDALQRRTQPEDVVVVYFAGHGTAQGKRFYLIPHDLGYSGDRMKVNAAGMEQILRHSISDEELEAAFERIDAGQLLMVLDACNSGQALEAEEKRRGPMNSKGLAQLAYEKGMYILTAAQSFQAAQEASQLGHGLLTYALIEEGLKQGVADGEPQDGQIAIREWLDYATGRVPQMQVEKMQAARAVGLDLSFKEEERGLMIGRRSGQQPRVFYRRELEQRPLIVARPGASNTTR